MCRILLVDTHLRVILQDPALLSLVEFLPLDPTQEKGTIKATTQSPNEISANIVIKDDSEHKNTFLLFLLFTELNFSLHTIRTRNKIISFNSFNGLIRKISLLQRKKLKPLIVDMEFANCKAL